MTQGTNIFVIIVTYNAMPWIEKCLNSIVQSTIPLHTVVVDNGSTDNTVRHIQTHYPEIVLLPQAENLGFGQGNNAGIVYAMAHGATHVLLLNQDAWIEPNMVEELLKYDDDHSLLSPIHLTGEGDGLDKNFREHAVLRSKELERLQADWAAGSTDKYATYEINAACWLLPEKIIREIGGFNPMFFHYAEDINYLHRLHYHGKGVYFVPKAKVYHDRANVPEKPLTEQYMYQQMLLRLLNINDRPCVAIYKRWRFVLAILRRALTKGEQSYLPMLWRAIKRIAPKKKEIKENRYIQQQIGNHWL